MRKKAILLVAFGLLLAVSERCQAAYVVRLRTQRPMASYLPNKTVIGQKAFRHICDKVGEPCKRYGSINLLESQNTGRLWPKTRRKLTHKLLAHLENEMNSFPSAEKKRQAIKNLEKRMSYFKVVKYRG